MIENVNCYIDRIFSINVSQFVFSYKYFDFKYLATIGEITDTINQAIRSLPDLAIKSNFNKQVDTT